MINYGNMETLELSHKVNSGQDIHICHRVLRSRRPQICSPKLLEYKHPFGSTRTYVYTREYGTTFVILNTIVVIQPTMTHYIQEKKLEISLFQIFEVIITTYAIHKA